MARLWRVKPWIDFESSDSTIGKSCNEKFRSRSYDSPGISETRSKVHRSKAKLFNLKHFELNSWILDF